MNVYKVSMKQVRYRPVYNRHEMQDETEQYTTHQVAVITCSSAKQAKRLAGMAYVGWKIGAVTKLAEA